MAPQCQRYALLPYLVDQAATLYQWETGLNQWNKFFGADGITIAPPKSLALTAAATFTNGSPDAGNNIRGALPSS